MRSKIIKHLIHNSPKADAKGYVDRFEDNILNTILVDDFAANLKQGDGNELSGKFRAVHSSSALGVNFFGFFKRNLDKFSVFGEKDFLPNAQFEKKLSTGLKRLPNLDFYLENDNVIIGFESKFLETLSRKQPIIQIAYTDELLSKIDSGLIEIVNRYRKNTTKSYLDTAQLIKHSIGLLNNKGTKKAKLVYIYWEPLNAQGLEIYEQHKKELNEFSKLIKCVNGIEFHHTSYLNFYDSFANDQYFEKHLKNFRDRYFFDVN